MKITFFGTTTLLFDDKKEQILFDAHLTRPSLAKMLFGTLQTNRALCDRILEKHHIDTLKAIFISHTHHDHVLDMPYIAKKCGASVYGSASALNVARGGGVAEDRLHLFDIGDGRNCREFAVGDYKITVFRSIHSKPHWYNNDIGKEITAPLVQPAPRRAFKEGGSFDFLIESKGKRYLIRPSFNYLPHELDGVKTDVLFLGITGIANAKKDERELFFRETADKVQPSLIIPIHWDSFFLSLDSYTRCMPLFIENSWKAFYEISHYCEKNGVSCLIQPPLTSLEL